MLISENVGIFGAFWAAATRSLQYGMLFSDFMFGYSDNGWILCYIVDCGFRLESALVILSLIDYF